VADVSKCVLVNVITSRVVPPALMVVGENDFEIVGRLGVMVSISAAVHVPVLQPMPLPVFVTPEGTEMEAVFVTCVCANAGICIASRKTDVHRMLKKAPADRNRNIEDVRRLNTFLLLFSKNTSCYLFLINLKTPEFTEINPWC
jgi:hypothetical protein